MQTIVNLETGEVQEVELSEDEMTEREQVNVQVQQRETEQEAKAAARTSALAKLAELGLTEEEVAAL